MERKPLKEWPEYLQNIARLAAQGEGFELSDEEQVGIEKVEGGWEITITRKMVHHRRKNMAFITFT